MLAAGPEDDLAPAAASSVPEREMTEREGVQWKPSAMQCKHTFSISLSFSETCLSNFARREWSRSLSFSFSICCSDSLSSNAAGKKETPVYNYIQNIHTGDCIQVFYLFPTCHLVFLCFESLLSLPQTLAVALADLTLKVGDLLDGGLYLMCQLC